MVTNLALNEAKVETAAGIVPAATVIARRGEAKAIVNREVVAAAMFVAIEEVSRHRVYRLHLADGGVWTITRPGGCRRCSSANP